MNKDETLRDLIAYAKESNSMVIHQVTSNEKKPDKVIELLNHIFNAHRIWNNRITNSEVDVNGWEEHSISDWQEINEANYTTSEQIIQNFNANQSIHYTDTEGASFENSVSEIIRHIVNHSTYHKGQIAMLMRQAGLEPVETDYIYLRRKPLK